MVDLIFALKELFFWGNLEESLKSLSLKFATLNSPQKIIFSSLINFFSCCCCCCFVFQFSLNDDLCVCMCLLFLHTN